MIWESICRLIITHSCRFEKHLRKEKRERKKLTRVANENMMNQTTGEKRVST
jgi:hypothetical protein